jgi:hypothetical protein
MLLSTYLASIAIMESGSFRPDYLFAPESESIRYYIIIDEVFFDNFLVIIYLLVVCKKIKISSFCSTLIIYLLVVYKKNNNSFILVYFCQRSQAKLFLQNYQKNTQEQQKVFFCTNPKVHEMTKMLYKCANNLFF